MPIKTMEAEIALEVLNITKQYTADMSYKSESFSALKNCSFTLQKGEVLGIIGKNGAGKSTLLKVLAGVSKPTMGEVLIYGKLSSILEIGAGFHPDLSGRDNVYLNGSLLGLNKKEIEAKYDEIVAFSELEEHIKQPVKTYSSGMYLRLAFSVFTHLATDILLLDEVMAVGDASFMNKCRNKILELKKEGKSLIIAGHNFHEMQFSCDKAIWLDAGEIKQSGSYNEVANNYIYSRQENQMECREIEYTNDLNEKFWIKKAEVFAKNKPIRNELLVSDEIQISISYLQKIPIEKYGIVVQLSSHNAMLFSDCEIYRENYTDNVKEPGEYNTTCILPAHLLNSGLYFIDIYIIEVGIKTIELPKALIFKLELDAWERNKEWGVSLLNFPIKPQLHWNTTQEKIAANDN
jgi:lipopolysaccharide transport system ATP-binding protein